MPSDGSKYIKAHADKVNHREGRDKAKTIALEKKKRLGIIGRDVIKRHGKERMKGFDDAIKNAPYKNGTPYSDEDWKGWYKNHKPSHE